MLNTLYKLPKALLASLFIGGGILFIIMNDPPHHFCDSQIEHFKKVQKGLLFDNSEDFRKEKKILKRKQTLCKKENTPGACYEYFAYLKKILRGFDLISQDCLSLVYSQPEVKGAFSSALMLMTAVAWREEALTGRVSRYHWLTRSDLYLFCEVKNKYIMQYGQDSYQLLENQILKLLPVSKKVPIQQLMKKTILHESCLAYR